MSSRQCMYSQDGRIKLFYCGHSQTCCLDECCTPDASFYTHWYFWLAITVLIIFLIAAVVSGYCHHRRVPPYRLLNALPGQVQPPLLPWIWSLDEDPTNGSAVSSPRDFQTTNPQSPFVFPSSSSQQQQHSPSRQQQCHKQQQATQHNLAVPTVSSLKYDETCRADNVG